MGTSEECKSSGILCLSASVCTLVALSVRSSFNLPLCSAVIGGLCQVEEIIIKKKEKLPFSNLLVLNYVLICISVSLLLGELLPAVASTKESLYTKNSLSRGVHSKSGVFIQRSLFFFFFFNKEGLSGRSILRGNFVRGSEKKY